MRKTEFSKLRCSKTPEDFLIIMTTYYCKKAMNTFSFISILMIFILSPYQSSNASQQHFDNDLTTARETLINFFNYVHNGQFKEALPLFEPWEDGIGEQRSSWEGLSSFSPPEERSDRSKVLSNYCNAVGTCLIADVVNIEKTAKGKYRLRVQFLKDNGSVYIYTPCCGATEEQMPLKAVFTYYVHKLNGVYVVRTPPIYRP